MARRTPITKRVAEQIRTLRERQGLSQAELARRAHTSRSQIVLIERGERAPNLRSLETIARALDVDAARLLDDDDQAEPVRQVDHAERLAQKIRARGPKCARAVDRLISLLDAYSK